MAWYAIFRLLSLSNPARAARPRDVLTIMGLCLLVFLPTSRMIWVAAGGVAVYLLLCAGRDRSMRAAGTVLAALSVQELWGHVLFDLIAAPLLNAETAVVGTMLQFTHSGTVWHDNVITTPSGHGILLYPYCSSFHNISLALLCWIVVSRLRNVNWRGADIIMGGVVAGAMVVLNTTRLYLMARDTGSYHYWHEGTGADIFTIAASLSVLLLSLYGSRPLARPR